MNQVKYCDLIDCENNEDARSGHRMVVINDILYVIGIGEPMIKLQCKVDFFHNVCLVVHLSKVDSILI